MTSPGRGATIGGPGAPAPAPAWPRYAAAALVLVLGVAVAVGLHRAALDQAAEREALVADQTANVVTATLEQLPATVAGAHSLVGPDGEVDLDAFATYAEAAIESSPFRALAVVLEVPADQRPALERELGGPIREEVDGPPAERRDRHLVVRAVSPPDLETTASLVGVDLTGDGVRRATMLAARDSGDTAVSGIISAVPSGEPAVFVAHPLYRTGRPPGTVVDRRAAIVGYVTSGLVGTGVLDAVERNVGDPVGIRIDDPDSGRTLAESDPAPGSGVTVRRRVAGREWLVTVDDRQSVSLAGPAVTVAGSAALAVALALLGRRAQRHRRDVTRHVELLEGIASLGRSLAAAGSVDDLAAVVRAEVPAALGARWAELELPGTTAPTRSAPPGAPDGDEPSPEAREVVSRREVGSSPDGDGAALTVAWPAGAPPDELTLAGLTTVTEMCAQTLARARLSDRARSDAVSSRLLAGLAEAAATAATTDQVARTLAGRAADVPGATSADIALLSDDGAALRVVHGDEDVPDDHLTVRPPDRRWPVVAALLDDAPVLLGDLDAVAARFPEHEQLMRAHGLAALACLPLHDEDGRSLGVLSLAWDAPRRFTAELVDDLRITADICASSLQRARQTDRDHARSSALATLAGLLSAARTFDDVGRTIIAEATPVLDADLAMVGVVEGEDLHLLLPDSPAVRAALREPVVPLDSDFPALLAIRRRELVTFPSTAAVPDRELAAALDHAGVRAGACAPLLASDGEPVGVLVVLWRHPPRFDEALAERVRVVAELCAQSAERSRLFDAEHQVRSDLERSVVVRLPEVEGLDVAARYRPAAPSVGMGGDWYDALTLPGGRLCLVVGDVTGHGVPAVAKMTQVRTVVHTLAAGGTPLPDILVRTSEVMVRDDLGYATVLIAVVDPRAGTLSYVTAGHLPPLVRRPGGSVDILTGGRHSVLGIELTPRPPGFLPFPAGSTLVIYTDGLIERRDTAIDVSVATLADTLRATAATTAEELADELLDHRGPNDVASDDVALVVARHLP